MDLTQKVDGWVTTDAAATLKKLVGPGNLVGTPQEDGKATVCRENNQMYIIFPDSYNYNVRLKK